MAAVAESIALPTFHSQATNLQNQTAYTNQKAHSDCMSHHRNTRPRSATTTEQHPHIDDKDPRPGDTGDTSRYR
jgi:hypothetical protein